MREIRCSKRVKKDIVKSVERAIKAAPNKEFSVIIPEEYNFHLFVDTFSDEMENEYTDTCIDMYQIGKEEGKKKHLTDILIIGVVSGLTKYFINKLWKGEE